MSIQITTEVERGRAQLPPLESNGNSQSLDHPIVLSVLIMRRDNLESGSELPGTYKSHYSNTCSHSPRCLPHRLAHTHHGKLCKQIDE